MLSSQTGSSGEDMLFNIRNIDWVTQVTELILSSQEGLYYAEFYFIQFSCVHTLLLNNKLMIFFISYL
jgi:hypothetical protein